MDFTFIELVWKILKIKLQENEYKVIKNVGRSNLFDPWFIPLTLISFFLILDRRTLPLDRRHHVFHNGTLLINKVARKDSGIYSCTATGRQGASSTQSGHLKVIGKLDFFS